MTRGIVVAVISLLAALSGCTEIPRPGPGEVAITKGAGDLAGFTLIDVNADTIGPYMLVRRGDSGGTIGTGYSPRIHLAPGDIIRISIAESKEGGLFAPLAAAAQPSAMSASMIAARSPSPMRDACRSPDLISSGSKPGSGRVLPASPSNRRSMSNCSRPLEHRSGTGEVARPAGSRFSTGHSPSSMPSTGPAVHRGPAHQTDVVLRRGRDGEAIALLRSGRPQYQLQQGRRDRRRG